MTLTGSQLLTGFSRFLGDETLIGGSAATSNGTTTTIVDTTLSRLADDALIDYYFRITQAAHSALWEIRRATDFANSTGTVTVSPAYTAALNSAQTYEIHRYDPAEKFVCLDLARLRVYPDLAQVVYDASITGDGRRSVFPIPSAVRFGPTHAQLESPIPVDTAWNFIQDPRGDSTTNWSASNTTATTVDQLNEDYEIPKYDPTCTKLATAGSTNGQYSQVVGSMTNNITAALAGGRRMTFGAWVYCRTASRVTLQLIDDSATNSSSSHGGSGWELLTVTANIVAANATTLTARFNISSDTAAVDMWWNRAWLYYGEGDVVTDLYRRSEQFEIRRDDTTQTLDLTLVPGRGIQVRLVGRDVLSALGTTASTQVTNTMEVDAIDAELLYAEAARILFERQGLQVDDFPNVAQRIAIAERRRSEIRRRHRHVAPAGPAMKGPWVA